MTKSHLIASGLVLAFSAGIGQITRAQTSSSPNSQATARSSGSSQTTSEQSGTLNARHIDLAEGSRISAALLSSVDARTAKPGDQVVARVTKNVKEHGRTVVKKGDELVGRITAVQAAGAANAGSSLGITFDGLIQGGSTSQLNAVITSIVSTPSEQRAEQQMQQSEASLPAGGPGVASGSGGGGLMGGASGRTSSGGGGLLGGAGSTVSSTANVTGSAPGSVPGTAGQAVGSTVNSAANATESATGNVAGAAAGTISANGRGALSNATSAIVATPRHAIHLDTQAAGSQQAGTSSVLSTRKGNLGIEQGTEVQFRVVGSADAK